MNQKKIIYFFLFLDLVLLPIFEFIGQAGFVQARGFFKYIYAGIFLTATISSIIKKRVYLTPESQLLLFFGFIATIIGLLNFGINSETYSHLYAVIMPVIMISNGYYIGKSNFYDTNEDKKYGRMMFWIFVLNAVTMLLYRVSFILGIVPYPAIATSGLFFSSLYYLSKKNMIMFIFGLILVIISGKRVTLVILLASAFYHLIRVNRLSLKNIFRMFFGSAFFGAMGYYLLNFTPYLNRFVTTFTNLNSSSTDSLDLATGGRASEILAFSEYLSKQPYRWLFGSGTGFKVEVFDGFYRHYSHFTPMGYIALFGIIFTVLLYLMFFKRLFNKIEITNTKYIFHLYYVGLLISSFSGGILFNDYKFWLFLGLISSYSKKEILDNEGVDYLLQKNEYVRSEVRNDT